MTRIYHKCELLQCQKLRILKCHPRGRSQSKPQPVVRLTPGICGANSFPKSDLQWTHWTHVWFAIDPCLVKFHVCHRVGSKPLQPSMRLGCAGCQVNLFLAKRAMYVAATFRMLGYKHWQLQLFLEVSPKPRPSIWSYVLFNQFNTASAPGRRCVRLFLRHLTLDYQTKHGKCRRGSAMIESIWTGHGTNQKRGDKVQRVFGGTESSLMKIWGLVCKTDCIRAVPVAFFYPTPACSTCGSMEPDFARTLETLKTKPEIGMSLHTFAPWHRVHPEPSESS